MATRRRIALFAPAAWAALAVAMGCSGSAVTGPDGTDGGPPAGDAASSSSGGVAPGCGAEGAACCNGTACNDGLFCAAGACAAMVSGASSSSGGTSGAADGSSSGDAQPDAPMSTSNGTPCASGSYTGTLTGLYSTPLTGGSFVPITVAGDVSFTLDQVGTAQQTCMVQGESDACSDIFAIDAGTVTSPGGTDAGLSSGLPFFCTMTGTLICKEKEVVNGWVECTYCIAGLNASKTGCASGAARGFAGPLTATYDYVSLSFSGSWNGPEVLAGNDGGPDGGPIYEYLSDSGYSGPGSGYGGSGPWTATHQP